MGLKIFVVEDDNTYSKMVQHRLKQFGFENVQIFPSGEECLDQMHKKPDLVLLDFSLGGLNGLDILMGIKKRNPKTEIIVLTGLDDEKLRIRCMEAGALAHLSKSESSFDQIKEFASDIHKNKMDRLKKAISFVVIIVLILTYFIFF